MAYKIAGIDVHKKMLAVVVAEVTTVGEYEFQRRKFLASPSERRQMAEWLIEEQVEEVVMESTAQYWRPVWQTLERYAMISRGGNPFEFLELAHAGRIGPAVPDAILHEVADVLGRKSDWPDEDISGSPTADRGVASTASSSLPPP